MIGAGVGGLAAGLALARRGAAVKVFEAAAALGEVGAGVQIGPNGVAALEALGVRDAAAAVASAPEAIELRDFRSGRVARLPLGEASVARYGRPYWQMHRADLIGVLLAAATAAGVRLRLGARVVGMEDFRGGVRLDLGGAGVEAEAVIAADGLRSEVRARRFGGAAPRFAGHVAWRGLVTAARVPAGLFPAAACVTMGPGRHLVTYPLRGGTLWNFVAVEERAEWAAEGWSTPDDPDNLRRAFAGWGGAAETLLGAVETTFLWGLFDHAPLPVWTKGRVALLGDACHPMLPFLAQGATMALEDACVLADALAQTPDVAAGLSAYAERRRPRTTRVQRAAARNGRVYHLANPVARTVAHLGLRAASGIAPGMLLRRFDWLYGADVTAKGGLEPNPGAAASDQSGIRSGSE